MSFFFPIIDEGEIQNMDIIIRHEEEEDYLLVENLIREAFYNVYKPGCEEHLIAHRLRQSAAFVPELDLLVTLDDEIIGQILYTRALIEDGDGNRHTVLCFGPVSVHPRHQKRGVGRKLIETSMDLAWALGYKGIVIYGSPLYYHQFGFQDASVFGITTAEGENFEAFMAVELKPGALSGIHGRFYADPAFNVTPEDVTEFERSHSFPPLSQG